MLNSPLDEADDLLQVTQVAHYIAVLLSPFYSVCHFVKDEFKDVTAKSDPAIYALQISANLFDAFRMYFS